MNLLITGALGHIGSALIRQLPIDFPHAQITLVDDLSTQRYGSLFHLPAGGRYHFIEAKVQEYDVSCLLPPMDAVIHLAALTDAAGTADQPERVHQNNFESTKKMAEACLTHNIPFIFPSSTSVYGSQDTLVDEDCPELLPQSPYAESKIKEELFLQELFAKGLKGVICRLGTIYGISSGMRFHTAVNKFCWQATMGQSITVWETALDQKRPYLSLQDAIKGFVWVLSHQLYDGRIYNFVSGNHTVREVIDHIRRHLPDLKISLVAHKIMNQLSYEVSSQRFQQTGFAFQGDIGQGVAETLGLLKPLISSK